MPHAEVSALQSLCNAGRSALQGGTAYVTLEPCSHHGKTPPCSDALIRAGIARLVVGAQDPDQRVNGAGLSHISAANIEVRLGVMHLEVEELLSGFITRLQTGKPFCSLKIATSMDGRVGLSDRKKRWLTGSPMRRFVHLLRSHHDAIVTGVGTVLSDDPRLNCRIEGIHSDSPPIYVFVRLLRTPTTAKLLESKHKVTFFCGESATKRRRNELMHAGASIVQLPNDEVGKPDINAGLQYLGTKGVNHALIEAGPGIVTSILAADAVDRIFWTQSDHILGASAIAAVDKLGAELVNKIQTLPQKKYLHADHRIIGEDRLVTLTKSRLNNFKAGA